MRPAAVAALLLTQHATGQEVEMSWNIDPKTRTYVNEQTKVAFRESVAGFRLQDAVPGSQDGTATFSYFGRHGVITVLFVPRAVVGCAPGQNCAAPAVAAHSGQMKQLHGKSDLHRTFRLQGVAGVGAKGLCFALLLHLISAASLRILK